MPIFEIILLLSGALQIALAANITNHETLLYKALLDRDRYDTRAAPENFNDKGQLQTLVKIQLELMGITEFDKDTSSVTFKAAFRQWWYDPRLTWNTSDYGGVDTIWLSTTTDPAAVWHPDIIIREDSGDGYFSNFKDTQVRVRNDGLHYWTRLGELKVVSSFDFSNYPFDKQTINMTVGSWLYLDSRIKFYLHEDPFLIQDPNNWFLHNTEWYFVNSSVKPVYLNQTLGFRTYYRFQVELQREGGTILVAMIIPGCLVAALGSLYYLLPRGTGQRISYLATIMLTEIMFLVMITQFVPQSKIVPNIAYLFLQQTIILACLAFTVLVIDRIQKIRDSRQKDKLLKCKHHLVIIKKRNGTIHRKGSQHGLNSNVEQNSKANEAEQQSSEEIQNLLNQEKATQEELDSQEQKLKVDKCMDVFDLLIFIANVIAFIAASACELVKIFGY